MMLNELDGGFPPYGSNNNIHYLFQSISTLSGNDMLNGWNLMKVTVIPFGFLTLVIT